MSTSPTLMSWRRKSSVKSVSSANSTSEHDLTAVRHVCRKFAGLRLSYESSDAPQPEPVKLVWAHGQKVREITDAGENVPAKHLNQNIPFVASQIQLDRLRGAGEIVHDQDRLLAQLPDVGQNPVIRGKQKLDRA